MLLIVVLVGCSKSDDESNAIDINANSIAAMWRVTATNDGTGWASCDTDNFDDMKWLILAEDGYYVSFLDFSIRTKMASGTYTFYNNTATLSDIDGVVRGKCVFSEVRKQTATASLFDNSGDKIDVRLYRDNRRPITYLNPATVLKGHWQLVKSRDYISDNAFDADTDGEAIFDGNNVTFNLYGSTYHTTFYRISLYHLMTDDGNFSIQQSDNPDEINVAAQPYRKIMVFKRQ